MKNLAPRLAAAALLCAAAPGFAHAENEIPWGRAVYSSEWELASFADLNNVHQKLWFPRNQLYSSGFDLINDADVPLYRLTELAADGGTKRYQAHLVPYKGSAFKTGIKEYGGVRITLPETKLKREWRDNDRMGVPNPPRMLVLAPPADEAREPMPRMPFSELEDNNNFPELYYFYGEGENLLKQAKRRFLPLEMLLGDGARIADLSIRPKEGSALCTAINRRDETAVKDIVLPARASALEKLKAAYAEHKALLNNASYKAKFSRLEGELLWPLTAEMPKADRASFAQELENSLASDEALAGFVAKWRKTLLAELVIYQEEAAAEAAKEGRELTPSASLEKLAERFGAIQKGDPEAIKLAAARAEIGRTPPPAAVGKDAEKRIADIEDELDDR